ncbi:Surface antigen [Cribrihabitans marinus]|uniref:Surface antigen n=1 Tax=Cribrihabitans marinus TaxID=1227549 RepID=A0A1H6VWF3_9RHOB|nr:BamA/TamA family outer membrane protein [Cribrihabitans marinus]GGH25660.1 membrane protein [Cribrihabitans marinus]SEJ04532.1 Surface antigen [Cribrihabitans marinus]
MTRATVSAGFLLGWVMTLAALPLLAEPATGVIDSQTGGMNDASKEETVGFRNGSVIVAPIPFSNPTVGSGLVLGAGYLFSLDPGSDPSMVGIAGLRSDNGSRGAGLAANFYFDNNRWKIESLFAEADIRYDLYTGLGQIPIGQKGRFARASLSYGFTPEFSVGLALRYLDTSITPDGPGLPAIPPPFDRFLNVEVASVGLLTSWDRRDDTIYPTRGFVLDAEALSNHTLTGLTGDYLKGYANFSAYRPIGSNGVLAGRLSACGASDETPFFDQCSLGATDGFRGFSVTQFLDRRSVSAQLEYRHRFGDRFGAVLFGGAGRVGDSFGNLDADGTHSAVGLGARYRVSRKFPVDFSVDLSRNNEGDDVVYVYVGQRF